ncbi:UxaA family hydrolase [Sphingomonas glacialis]|uniref:Altronate hydrolase n=1 Tax=Sphingomonas glacialis TaxID=658225 RepID=A0A502FYY0_9SPHN|nr:UxaA family hydrolase [Sphingomonas glacialis]TPG54689.1 altronate hydrolase [Sphingomonas glacialis]
MSAILLHPDDTILVVTAALAPGDTVLIDDTPSVIQTPIGVGHKIARQPLAAGETVIKYGAPIGSMTASAGRAEHVHLHNMKSDYIASHLRDTLDRSPS